MFLKFFLLKIFNLPRNLRKKFYLRFNKILFFMNDISFGSNFMVFNHIHIRKCKGSRIEIGNDFQFQSGEAFNPLSRNIRGCIHTQYPSSEILIGNQVGISSACLWAKSRISIGNRVQIGADCIIMDTDAHNLDYMVRASRLMNEKGYSIDSFTANSSPITIGDDVLIGTRSIILKGVTIGERTVIGSGSVVTRDIPSDCIAAGNPCKVIIRKDI